MLISYTRSAVQWDASSILGLLHCGRKKMPPPMLHFGTTYQTRRGGCSCRFAPEQTVHEAGPTAGRFSVETYGNPPRKKGSRDPFFFGTAADCRISCTPS